MATTSASAGARVWRRGRPARLGLTALVGGLVLLAGPTVPAASAGTSSVASACGSLSSGVTVVIDTGSSISTRCAGGDPASAMSALQTVASVVTPQRYPGSVVCRIDGYPASDPCIQMPPASAYWSFLLEAKQAGINEDQIESMYLDLDVVSGHSVMTTCGTVSDVYANLP